MDCVPSRSALFEGFKEYCNLGGVAFGGGLATCQRTVWPRQVIEARRDRLLRAWYMQVKWCVDACQHASKLASGRQPCALHEVLW